MSKFTRLLLLAALVSALTVIALSASADAADTSEASDADGYRIIVQDGSGKYGSVFLEEKVHRAGDTVSVGIVLKDSGMLRDIKCRTQSGRNVPLEEDGHGHHTFVMPAENVKLTASFGPIMYRVTVVCPDGGGTAHADREWVEADGVVQITPEPDPGNAFENMFLDFGDVTMTTMDTHFTMYYDSDVTVSVRFDRACFHVDVDPDIRGGRVLTTEVAYFGDKVDVVSIPDPGMELVSLSYITSSGETVPINGDSFRMPASQVTVTAVFAKLSAYLPDQPPDRNGPAVTAAAAGLIVLSLFGMLLLRRH